MKISHIIILILILGVLFFLVNSISWTNANIISGAEDDTASFFSGLSPIIFGILVMGVIFVLVLISEKEIF